MFGSDISVPLTDLLGDGKKTRGNNHIYFCPVCKHRKRKLEIDHSSYKWHCWVCNRGGRSISTLLSWLNVRAVEYRKFSEFLSGGTESVTHHQYSHTTPALPHEFIPLAHAENKNSEWVQAMDYLIHKRNIRVEDILRYNIGYCESGRFSGRIIIPSYDCNFDLNFFDARTYKPNETHKFLNVENINKNIVGFDGYIDWSDVVILVESSLNAITLRNNACPLYGKALPTAVLSKLRTHRPEEVILWLDSDATKDAINILGTLISNGVKCRWVHTDDGKDINDYGYDTAHQLLINAEAISYSTIMKYRAKYNI